MKCIVFYNKVFKDSNITRILLFSNCIIMGQALGVTPNDDVLQQLQFTKTLQQWFDESVIHKVSAYIY